VGLGVLRKPLERNHLASATASIGKEVRERDQVLAAHSGDEVSFGVLIAREERWTIGLARLVLGSESEAEDAFQEACLLAWRDLPKLRDASLWRPWFRRVATNAVLEYGRRISRRPRVTELEIGEGQLAPDPVADVIGRDLLVRALVVLSPEERTLLALRYGRDVTMVEAARLLGLPVGTAKARAHRALRKLRLQIESDSGL
jgi:RNA polymerase sigma-70 factor (ECF subfamily)